MYYCKTCGFVPPNEEIKWCNNLRCASYGTMLSRNATQSQTQSTPRTYNNETNRKPEPPCNSELPLALAVVPFQNNTDPLYRPSEALRAGTIFPKLDMPQKRRLRRK